MEHNSVSNNIEKVDEQTKSKIEDLCSFILVKGDSLIFRNSKDYIESIINDEIILKGDRLSIRAIVQSCVADYIGDCNQLSEIFAFSSDNKFIRYRNDFYNYYNEIYYKCEKYNNEFLNYQKQFDYVFDYIQEAIDFHTLFVSFSLTIQANMVDAAKKAALDEAVKVAVEKAVKAVKEAEQSAVTAAANAELAAKVAANNAVEHAINKVTQEEKIEEKIDVLIDKHMNKVMSKTSETNVTILGIFTTIMITIVAGLTYSSSVIDNVNAANFYRLLSVAALVGLVCYNLVISLINFIEKYKYIDKSESNSTSESKTYNSKANLLVNIALIIVMSICGIIQAFDVMSTNLSENSSNPNVESYNIDINIDTPDNSSDPNVESNNIDVNTDTPDNNNPTSDSNNIVSSTQ